MVQTMNIIITINSEDVVITRREANVLYNQLNEALFWEDLEANKKEDNVKEDYELYSLR